MEKVQCVAFTSQGKQCSFKFKKELEKFCNKHVGKICNHPYGTIHDTYLKHGDKRFILKSILFSIMDNHKLSFDEFIDPIDKGTMEELQKKKKQKYTKKFIRK